MSNSIQVNSSILPGQYQKTLESLKLKEVCLEEFHLSFDRDNIEHDGVRINIEHNTYSRQTPEQFFAYITYYLKGIHEEKTVLQIEAKYCIIHEIDEPIEQVFFDVFRSINLKMITFPYFRELVASITSRMEIKTLTLPYNVFIPEEEHSE